MSNPVVWWELATHDQEKSAKFFQDVFDWDLKKESDAGFYKMKHEPPPITGGGNFHAEACQAAFRFALYSSRRHPRNGKKSRRTRWSYQRPAL